MHYSLYASIMYYLILNYEKEWMSILHDAIMYISELNPLNLKITVSGQGFRIQYYMKTVGRKTPSSSINSLLEMVFQTLNLTKTQKQ